MTLPLGHSPVLAIPTPVWVVYAHVSEGVCPAH
eukprot:CAMPEP_0173374546 /NCGR_PEP_ID=MMETSP1144-20121109/29133_1 /TAXON_ID=483371 /ORGANISM="non described non described, Strain CCMP2298" /LENGTH=32 /DNA_ID= /DNA_START= /DNA_END= /DNA_ORIENTATION=